jgi:4-hydroxybenzoate polyprenyltransferase
MMFRFTPFSCITLFVMAITLMAAARRLRSLKPSKWLLGYFAVVLGFAFGFPYSLNLWWIFGGIALAWLGGAGGFACPAVGAAGPGGPHLR